MSRLARAFYNLLLPVAFVIAAPGWLIRMARRGGMSLRLWERVGIYDRPEEEEPAKPVYVHAVSVGEVLIALRLISRWKERGPETNFVLAATTTTGFAVAGERAPKGVRIIYSPVDFPFLVNRLFERFDPCSIVMIESELWPNLLRGAEKRRVPVSLVNARLSDRSARRYKRLAPLARPMLASLRMVCAQAEEHRGLWAHLGVDGGRLAVTGSVKFDPEGAPAPARRPEFEAMLAEFGGGRPVGLAASTHPGEEAVIARALAGVDGVLPVLVPRHAERRREVADDLEAAGFEVVLRSDFRPPVNPLKAVLVVDSTGELRDWTAHADVVVIGKSFEAVGGQNPSEAIAAGIPVVTGPHMENFEPLISQLREAGAVRTVESAEQLPGSLSALLSSAREQSTMTREAHAILDRHRGATARTLDHLIPLAGGSEGRRTADES